MPDRAVTVTGRIADRQRQQHQPPTGENCHYPVVLESELVAFDQENRIHEATPKPRTLALNEALQLISDLKPKDLMSICVLIFPILQIASFFLLICRFGSRKVIRSLSHYHILEAY